MIDTTCLVDSGSAGLISECGKENFLSLPALFPPDAIDFQPLRIEVAFTLTEWTCVYRELFEEFAVDSVEAAMERLITNQETFLVYRLKSTRVTPAWPVTADWPLKRRGNSDGVSVQSKSKSKDSDAELANTYVEIRNQPISPYKSRLMLKTGGQSVEDAIKRWTAVSASLRALI